MRTMLKWGLAACLVGMLTACSDKSSGGPSGGGGDSTGGGGTVQAGLLKGHVVDTQGQPLAGAVIYTTLSGGFGASDKTTADAQGNYQIAPPGQDVPYKAYAWTEVTYRGKKFCLRISPEDSSGYEAYYGRQGAIRNFHWRLQGRMEDSIFGPDEDGGWYGGTIRLFPSFEDGDVNSVIELKLTPSAPLIDGSTGTELTRTVDLQKTQYALDIPPGAYKLSATRVKSDGTRVAARLGSSSSEGSSEFDFEFKPVTSQLDCGSGAAISGLDRGFVYVISP